MAAGGIVVVVGEKVEKVHDIGGEGVYCACSWQKAVDTHIAIPPGVKIPGVTSNRHCFNWVSGWGFGDGPNASIQIQPKSRGQYRHPCQDSIAIRTTEIGHYVIPK